MILNKFTLFFARQVKCAISNHSCLKFIAAILLLFNSFTAATASPPPEKMYARIAYGTTPDTRELNLTSIGVISFENNMVGHVDLGFLNSDTDGKAAVLDLGAGLAFSWYVSPYLSIGASLGYNWDRDEAIAAYFPEVGVVVDFSKTFGMSLSARRYYSLYEQDENMVMLGLVFKK
jgi:hypothetical protein